MARRAWWCWKLGIRSWKLEAGGSKFEVRTMPWDPERYEQFERERYAPFDDLSGLVEVREGLRVIDLGCGTGELTRRLADALPESAVLGIDSSPEMLARAA